MPRVSPTSVAAVLSIPLLAPGLLVRDVYAQAPSIVLIVTDDQRWDTVTPMLTVSNELVQKGIQFTNTFAATPLCAPGRVGILTGQYAHHNDVWRNSPPHGGFDSFVDSQSLAVWLQGAGYTTSLIDKYLNGYPSGAAYVPPGWSNWLAFVGEPGYYNYYLNRNGVVEYHGNQIADYSTDFLGQQAADFIRATEGPIFLEFTPKAPHDPAIPAERHKEKFSNLLPFRPPNYNETDVRDKPAWLQALPVLTPVQMTEIDDFRKDQLRTLLAVDEAIASILTALDQTGRLSNTMIVFTSDNGFLWGEHRWASKYTPYEEDIRVPLVIRYDPLAGTPRRMNRAAMNIDIAPTLLELAGTAPPPGFTIDGASLMPFLRGETPPWRKEFIVEYLHDQPAVPTYCSVRRAPGGQSSTNQDAYTRLSPSGEEEFYDLPMDPYQLDNRVNDPLYASRVASLRELWAGLCPPAPEP